jgi:hypothetical protein
MEPDTSPTAPKERASILQYQHYVEETMQNLRQPGDIHTQIVDSFGISIKGKDFATLQANMMLCDGIMDWMCQWWTTQVGGGIGADSLFLESNGKMVQLGFSLINHSDTEASPPSGLEALIRRMTIHDNQPSFAEKSRLKHGIEHRGPHVEGVYPHLHEERGPPSSSSLSTSLPHYRSAMEDQPPKSEKCSLDDQPSDVKKNNLGYAEQMNGSTHEKQPTPVIVRPLGSPNSSAGGPSDSYSESSDKCWSKKLDKQFQSALKQKLSRSDSTWISAAT